MQKKQYQILWLIISLTVLVVIALATIHQPVWGDERHTVETIQLFGASHWPQILFNYPEVTPPLFYVLYAAWGSIWGFDLETLRIFSLIIALAVFIMLYKTAFRFLQEAKTTFVVSLCFLINPYILGLSGFVFTDMLTLFFILCAIYFFEKKFYETAAGFAGLGLLCRQYVLFIVLAMWTMVLIMDLVKHTKRSFVRFSLSIAIASLPLMICMYIWKGMAPPMGMARWIMPDEYTWNPHALITYIAFTGIYLLPIVLFTWRKSMQEWKLLLGALFCGAIYFVFPVKVSLVTHTQTAHDTVGLVHRALDFFVGHGIFESIILYFFTCVGLWVLFVFILQDLAALKHRNIQPQTVLSFCYYFFLLIMPFSYQVWEKYLVLVWWAAAIRWTLTFAGTNLTQDQNAEYSLNLRPT
ncbi:MAG TPA: hypothetical protein VMU30_07580 [Bacteroidota bacterium]|nr:hypothetical protein [Bacteroidota bacterium]